jgi:hypothetical protein
MTRLRLLLFLAIVGLAVGLAIDLALTFDFGRFRVNRVIIGLFVGLLPATVAIYLLSLNYLPPRPTGQSLDRLVAARRSRLSGHPEDGPSAPGMGESLLPK